MAYTHVLYMYKENRKYTYKGSFVEIPGNV